MTTGNIEIKGVTDAIQSLLKVDKAIRLDFVKTMSKATGIVNHKAQEYAPKLPGQKYIRTYKLKRGWRTEKATATRGIVANRGVPYAQYVQSSKSQAEIHQGRWNTEKDIVKQAEDKVQKLFDEVIKRTIR